MSDFNTTISFDVFSVSLSGVDEGTLVVVRQYVDEQLDSKQDTLIAGDNITIVGNVISSSGGGSVEHDDTLNKNGNPDFLHATQAQHDRWTNNYSYKIEDTDVLAWDDSTTYSGFGYQAHIFIDGVSEDDFVNVVFGLLDAISGNYAPAIEIYSDYILVFSKVNTAITIPTIEITKIDL